MSRNRQENVQFETTGLNLAFFLESTVATSKKLTWTVSVQVILELFTSY